MPCIKRAKRGLKRIDPGPAMGRVDHEAHAPARCQRRTKGRKARRRIRQVMQHAAAVYIVKLPKIRRIQKRTCNERDRAQTARLGPRLGNAARGRTEVDIGDLHRTTHLRHHLRQLDKTVTRATPGKKRTQGLRPVARAAVEEMIQLQRMRGRALNEAARLVRRIAGGIRVGLILIFDGVHWASLGWDARSMAGLCCVVKGLLGSAESGDI